MQKYIRWIIHHHYLSLTSLLFLLMIVAFHRQVPVDDAYISYRYAQNFVEGHGIVWNPGEHVEGYSNFLWLLLIALGMKFGVSPENFTVLISIPLHLLGLFFTYLLARKVLDREYPESQDSDPVLSQSIPAQTWALLVLLWVGTNNSLAAFTTSGMETPLQFLLYVSTAYLVVLSMDAGWTRLRLLLIGVLLNLAMLTRPDSAILIAGVFTVFYITHLKENTNLKSSAKYIDSALLILPFAVIVLPWLIWKLNFYGDLLPNSFHAKVKGIEYMGYGVFYLYIFMVSHLLFPFIAMLIWRGKWICRTNRPAGFFLVFLLVWTAYLIYVGGDFMEFRFMIPMLPFLGIAMIYMLSRSVNNMAILGSLVVLLLLGNVNNQFALEKTVYGFGIEKVESLKKHLDGGEQGWIKIGWKLKEMFGGTDVRIALGAAGAIPYISELPSVDFMGLCDAEIPKIAEKFSIVPGHRIISPLEYLVNRKVNLIIEPNNFMMEEKEFLLWVRLAGWRSMYQLNLNVEVPVNGRLLQEAILLAVPVEPDRVLVIWYLTPHPKVEEAISKYKLRRIRLVRR